MTALNERVEVDRKLMAERGVRAVGLDIAGGNVAAGVDAMARIEGRVEAR